MERIGFQDALAELSSAEEFLDYFAVPYDPAVVQVNRLHILQRFHDYIESQSAAGRDEPASAAFYRGLLQRAYQDFVTPMPSPRKCSGYSARMNRRPCSCP